jgi:hypothetical protein
MTTFRTSVEIHAPPGRVWAVMSDVGRWPEWTPSVIRIRRLGGAPFAVGSRFRIHQPKLLPATWRVTNLEESRSFTWVASGPGLSVTGRHAVEPAEHGSRATLSIEFEGVLGPLVARLTRGLNEHYLGLEAAGLKRRSEGDG